jgi:hypothetical protein
MGTLNSLRQQQTARAKRLGVWGHPINHPKSTQDPINHPHAPEAAVGDPDRTGLCARRGDAVAPPPSRYTLEGLTGGGMRAFLNARSYMMLVVSPRAPGSRPFRRRAVWVCVCGFLWVHVGVWVG